MLDRPLSECIDRAMAQLSGGGADAPEAVGALLSWTSRLVPTGHARDYFEGARASVFVLPWWLERHIRVTPDLEFQARLVESSINACYFMRVIDNVMDENAEDERRLLPVLGLLHSTFLRAYTGLFPPEAHFWTLFDRYWAATLEAAFREKTLEDVSYDTFVQVAARKTSGVKIPLAAVCCRYDRLDLLEPWCAFHDAYARWQQMADDVFDWLRDRRQGQVTFFLSEGRRRKRRGESVDGWVVRGGFDWALGWLDDAMGDLAARAEQLDSPELVRFLEYRAADVREHGLEIGAALNQLTPVADAFEPVDAQ